MLKSYGQKWSSRNRALKGESRLQSFLFVCLFEMGRLKTVSVLNPHNGARNCNKPVALTEPRDVLMQPVGCLLP